MACAHVFADPRLSCPHRVVGDGNRCLWHNPAVRKADPYVRALFLHTDGFGAGFSECHLAGIDLRELDLVGRDFTRTDLRDAVLDRAQLGSTDFTGANLRRTSLRGADLRCAILVGVNLTGASLIEADLRDADLSGAVLDGTVLLGADLRGANLAGAQVVDFQWNRLTRFEGVRGFDARPEQADGETTQIFLAPVAMPDLDTAIRLGFNHDADYERTRIFSVGRSSSTEQAPPPVAAMALPVAPVGGVRRAWLIVPAIAGLLIGAGMAGGTVAHLRPVQPPAPATLELAAAKVQAEADAAQIRALQEQSTKFADQLATLQQTTGADGARAALLAQQLVDAQADLARLLDADDRATAATLAVGERDLLTRDLATVTSRQERLSRILADGVERLRGENAELTTQLSSATTRVAALEATQAENVKLKQKLAVITTERDMLASLYRTATAELGTAKKDIERYLARVSGSQLAGLLTEEGAGVPLMPVVAGKPMSLGGDYLVTLAVETSKAVNGTLDLKLIIQRPAAAANPDATIVLYDEKKRPLRRLATSFPHVDQGAPFVSVGASISCDRMPAFARVVLAPGIEDVAAK